MEIQRRRKSPIFKGLSEAEETGLIHRKVLSGVGSPAEARATERVYLFSIASE